MKIRLSTIGALILAAGAGFLLFQTSQNVQQAEIRLRNTKAGLVKEQDSMRVLETEWDYLNRPDRLEHLAKQYLKMQPAVPGTLVHNESELTRPPELPKPAVHKPVMAAQPVALKSEPAPGHVVIPQASPPPLAPPTDQDDTHQQFDTLLNTLIKQEPASGRGDE